MSRIPKEIEQFIEANIRAVDQLSILLLLHGNPEQEWNAPSISRKLDVDQDDVITHLDWLSARGLITAVPGSKAAFRYASTASHSTVSRLAKLDWEQPVTIIKLIYAKARR